jgi:multiple sugar transport system permease protein
MRLTRRGQVASQLLLLGVAAFVLLPIWSLALLATDASILSTPTQLRLLPAEPTAERFIEAWVRPDRTLDFLGLLRNSLFVSFLAAGIALVFGASMASAFARLRFPGSRAGQFAVLVGAFLPPIAFAAPLFVLFFALENAVPVLRDIGFRGSTLALGLLYAAFALPLCVWLMRGAFAAVPEEVEESAFVEGADRRTAFIRIALPIAAPSILVAALVAFLLAYSEFAIGWLFASTDENVTLAMILNSASDGFFTPEWVLTAAHALLMTIPVVILFAILQRALLRSSLLGSATE